MNNAIITLLNLRNIIGKTHTSIHCMVNSHYFAVFPALSCAKIWSPLESELLIGVQKPTSVLFSLW